jgi:type II secretory pathway pseudopilin PulG
MSRVRRGFTLTELAWSIGIVLVLGAVVLVIVGSTRRAARVQSDGEQLRTIHVAMVTFWQSMNGQYPLPSLMERDHNSTVAEVGRAKDTSANIWSMMVFDGKLKPETLVSPLEVNPNIRVCRDYQYSNPPTALEPKVALWDPAFSANFTQGSFGNVSYAHLQPSDGRRRKWADTYDPTEAVLGNRGPEVTDRSTGADGRDVPQTRIPNSNTFLIHGPPTSWEGNVAFNDGHIDMVDTLDPRREFRPGVKWPTYKTRDKSERLDCLFYDEPDDVDGGNVYLGIWVKAGDKASDFRGIWD